MSRTKDQLRDDRDALEMALVEAGSVRRGTAWRCPFHDDRHPSGGIYESEGVWRFKCHTPSCDFCGDLFDVLAKHRGKDPAEILREMTAGSAAPPEPVAKTFPTVEALRDAVRGVEAAYLYTNPDTKSPDLIVIRSRDDEGRKKFIQAKPVPGGFVMKKPDGIMPIYNRIRLRQASTVLVVEGEKCVHAAHDVGFVATTSPGGAGKAGLADWSPLAGKTVYLWPDADEPDPKTGKVTGYEHMREVVVILEKLEPRPTILWIDAWNIGLKAKGDIADYVEEMQGSPLEDKRRCVQMVLDGAQPVGPSGDLHAFFEDVIAGRLAVQHLYHRCTSKLTNAMLPGTVTIVCGDPGSGKSFLVLEWFWQWILDGVKVAIYELEDDRTFHLQRACAQLEQNANLADMDWIGSHAKEVREAMSRWQREIDLIGSRIWDAPDAQIALAEIGEWVEARAAEGCRVVIVDPVTAGKVSQHQFLDDAEFMFKVKTAARRHACSVILVTHPKTGTKKAVGMDSLAGGSAYPRFSHCVMWLEKLKQRTSAICKPFDAPRINTAIDRTLNVVKGRNATGAGLRVGFRFDPQTLRLAEQGVVLSEDEAMPAEAEPVVIGRDIP